MDNHEDSAAAQETSVYALPGKKIIEGAGYASAGAGTPPTLVLEWTEYAQDARKAYQIEVRLTQEAEGGFSVCAPQLPGVVSQGETKEEAIENITEALLAAIESYRESHEEIPWQSEPAPRQSSEISRWIVVHV